MLIDTLFFAEKSPVRKVALLLTIPCAILPILMATATMMAIPFTPMLFKYDVVLFAFVYLLYGFGLFLSWSSHRKAFPILLFILHLIVLSIYSFSNQFEWLGYTSIISIIATSVSNQYFRMGSADCNECSQCENI